VKDDRIAALGSYAPGIAAAGTSKGPVQYTRKAADGIAATDEIRHAETVGSGMVDRIDILQIVQVVQDDPMSGHLVQVLSKTVRIRHMVEGELALFAAFGKHDLNQQLRKKCSCDACSNPPE
jgi:hypothetical protein